MLSLLNHWYKKNFTWLTLLLLPFAWLFSAIIYLRRFFYRIGLFKVTYLPVSVIVIGNITVGGTGKTPCVIWLANLLKEHGYQPGIISRGYRSRKHTGSFFVTADSLVEDSGDEALLIATRTNCPVVINRDRVQAAHDLLKKSQCNIIISDDGLQHYHLGRDIEIALVDGVRRFGNQSLLPAGPLREPTIRLDQVDFVIVNNGGEHDEYSVQVLPQRLVSLADSDMTKELADFAHITVHAVTGIGHPELFFSTLQHAGIQIIPHEFPDHHQFTQKEVTFLDDNPVIMTEKDAVKCKALGLTNAWFLQIDLVPSQRLSEMLLSQLILTPLISHS